jgi:hypothetical protein
MYVLSSLVAFPSCTIVDLDPRGEVKILAGLDDLRRSILGCVTHSIVGGSYACLVTFKCGWSGAVASITAW